MTSFRGGVGSIDCFFTLLRKEAFRSQKNSVILRDFCKESSL